MGSGTSAESLQNEATCPICLEYFREPVTLECGHNFCQACLSQCWEAPDPLASCPQCRDPVQQKNLRPNKQLANVIEIAKRLSLQAARAAGGKGMCGAHQETLKLFCEEDQSPICVVCHLSQAHRAHTAVPIEEAAQEYKEKIQAHLKILRGEREKLLGCKLSREERRQEYLKQTQAERQRIVAEFQQLRQFLEEQERLLLAQLQKLDQEIQNETVTRLSEEISRLSERIGELEETCHKPASEFLQDVRCLFSSYEKGWSQPPPEISPALEKRICDFSQKTAALRKTLQKFKDTLPYELEIKGWEPPGAYRQDEITAHVTLDPDTAHPNLALSEDRKCVSWADPQQPRPCTPDSFDTYVCVLGCEGFTSGRHCWEVEVEDGEYWAVGVARESVRRKGQISLSPEWGIWAVQCCNQFQALTSPVTPLLLSRAPRRIRVCLDCDRGQVTFIDAGAEAPIFTFPPGSLLPEERIRPWLWVGWGSCLRLCP